MDPQELAELLDELAREYGRQWELLLDGADYAMTGAWYEAGGSTSRAATWALEARPLIEGIQVTAADLATGWLDTQASFLGAVELPPATPTVLQPPTAVLEGPPKRMNRLLAQGLDYADALETTSGYVRRLTTTTARTAEQSARAQRADAVAQALPEDYDSRRRRGRKQLTYKRVPDARACGWCRVVADRLYSEEGASGSWHAFCRCTWRLAVGGDAATLGQYSRGRWEGVIDERAGKNPAALEPPEAPAAVRSFKPGDPWPDDITTTAEAVNFLQQAHPGLDLDLLELPDELADTTLRQLDQLATRHPDVAADIRVVLAPADSDRSAYAWYAHGGRTYRDVGYVEKNTITLGAAFRDPAAMRASKLDGMETYSEAHQRWVRGRGSTKVGGEYAQAWSVQLPDFVDEYTLTHEWGHAVDYVRRDQIAARVAEVRRTMPDGHQVVLEGVELLEPSGGLGRVSTLLDDIDHQLKKDSGYVSVYAQKNVREAYAEAYTAQWFGVLPAERSATLDALDRLADGRATITSAPTDLALAQRADGESLAQFLNGQDDAARAAYAELGIRRVRRKI